MPQDFFWLGEFLQMRLLITTTKKPAHHKQHDE